MLEIHAQLHVAADTAEQAREAGIEFADQLSEESGRPVTLVDPNGAVISQTTPNARKAIQKGKQFALGNGITTERWGTIFSSKTKPN